MQLFDAINRSDPRLRQPGESEFGFLNQSARSFCGVERAYLEEWFARYPPQEQAELRARFRDATDAGHLSAFYELYLHELLISLGFTVTVHPAVAGGDGKRPDFLVRKDGVPLFYVEARLVMQSNEETAEQARIEQVYRTLEGLHSPNFFLNIECHGGPKTPPSASKLRPKLERWLQGLDPDLVAQAARIGGLASLPAFSWTHDGWSVVFRALPKSPQARGVPGLRPLGLVTSGFALSTLHEAMASAVRAKSTKYSQLGLPYLVALNVVDIGMEDVHISDALLGSGNYGCCGPDGTLVKRQLQDGGAFLGASGPLNTRVSGVLLSHYLWAWNIHDGSPELIHNPFAALPIQPDLWPLRQATMDVDYGHLRRTPGKPIEEVLPAAQLTRRAAEAQGVKTRSP